MKKSEIEIISETIDAVVEGRDGWHQVIVNGRLDSSHADMRDAQRRMNKLRIAHNSKPSENKNKVLKLHIRQRRYLQESKN